MPVILWTESGLGYGKGDTELSLPGSGMAVPRGIEANFQYGNFTFNDVQVIDKYRITSIDGLDDADIRDSRELNPAYDGETAYDAHYGGRTLVFNGRIEAYQLAKLRDMQEALRTAFINLEEDKLYFLTGDVSKDHFIWCRKFSKIQWTEEQEDDDYFYRSFQITLRASNPRFLRHVGKTYTIYPNNIQNPDFEDDTVSNPPADWDSVTLTGNFTEDIFEVSTGWSYSGVNSTRIKLTKGADTTSSTWRFRTDPVGLGSMPVNPSAYYQFQINCNIVDKSSLGLTPKMWFYDNAGAFIDGSTKSGLNNLSDGQITLYASGIAHVDAVTAVVGVEVLGSAVSEVFDGYFDSVWLQSSGLSIPDQNDIGGSYVSNEGNYSAEPIIRVNGGLAKFHLADPNGIEGHEHILFSSAVPDGDFYEVDIAMKTMQDKAQVNKFVYFDQDSTWLLLKSGQSRLDMEDGNCIATSKNASIEISFRDSWI